AWLTGAGHAVALARDGPEALRRIVASVQTTESIELMVADFKIPGLNGLELIRAVRQLRRTLPVILMTAYGDDSVRNQMRGVRGSRYLEKPFEPEDLVQEIEELKTRLGE
ncbi:MAG: response regulator, partial [bacterium]